MAAHPQTADTELPPDGHVLRWTASRKEAVVIRVTSGEIKPGDAMRRWGISVEELDSWLTAYRRRGRKGLKVTAIQTQGRLL